MEYGIHEEISTKYKKETKEDSEPHTVTQYLLRPALIFSAQDNAHSRRRTGTYQRAKSMDDIHDRHRDGKTCNCQSANSLAKEDPIDDIIDCL